MPPGIPFAERWKLLGDGMEQADNDTHGDGLHTPVQNFLTATGSGMR